MARGNLRADIFLGDTDRSQFLALLERACQVDGLICHAYCLMGNHYHLLVETPEANIARAMHRINSGYAHRFNAVHGREGHVFERRYRSYLMRGQERGMEAARYIARNPVRAGICADPADWAWSSHVATAGLRPYPSFLTVTLVRSWFGADLEAARRYRSFVDAGIDEPLARPSLDQLISGGTLEEAARAHEQGHTLRDISALVGISPPTLSRRLRALRG